MSATILLVGIPQLSRSRALALTGLTAGMLGSLSLAAIAFGAFGSPSLPNLQAEMPFPSSRYVDFTVPEHEGEPYYRFDSVIRNDGPGAFEVYGAGNGNGQATLNQVIYGTAGGGVPAALNASVAPALGQNNVNDIRSKPGSMTWAGVGIAKDDHVHWHVANAARYELQTLGGDSVGTAAKVGFCMFDTYDGTNLYGGRSSVADNWCQSTQSINGASLPGSGAGASTIRMGISPGLGDLYGRDLTYQWLPINSVDPGNYRLVSTVDPSNLFDELSETDNVASQSVVIPGVAVTAYTTPAFRTGSANNTIALPIATVVGADVLVKREGSSLQTFSQTSLVAGTRYYVTTDPANGTISSEDGDRMFTYTPNPGFAGADTFTYLATDPRGFIAREATVTVVVGQVTVTPNSPRIETGQTQQFTAAPSAGLPSTVIWAVDGTTGGNSIVGTISASGLYAAPVAKGSHVIKATSTTASAIYGESPVDVGVSPAVAISPKTGALLTGHTLQFSASVTDGPPPISWLVNGVAGGNPSVGTVSTAGLYTAPALAPKAAVTVRAAMVGRPLVFGDASLTINAPAAPLTPPLPPTTIGNPTPPKGGKRLARIVVIGRSGGGVRVRVKLDRTLKRSRVTIQALGAKRKFTSWIGTRRANGTSLNLVLPLRGRNAVAVRAYVRFGKRQIFSAPVVITVKPKP